ncbi:SRPBCC family protein (plasmid) [Photobacterium sp. GJ3]|uniref:SRPBCC family protein n=1 Tax=Photobacterium sp. GJ3 TaxID=2829502 RepID=UPI001B8D13B9|nr:SRPBCC family protein [Photobacterium sp. GJ3]QUJ69287.1 SRPBCC family protein [Photobacterium sp. GJ3]
MPAHTISLEQSAQAPKEVLFQLLTDHQNLGRFFDGTYHLVKPGFPMPNGIGAIRRVSAGPFSFDEKVIDYKENEHLHYRIVKGGPLQEHGGWIQIQSLNAVTSKIQYRISFSPKVKGTGWIIKLLLEKSIRRALENIARHGESAWKR